MEPNGWLLLSPGSCLLSRCCCWLLLGKQLLYDLDLVETTPKKRNRNLRIM